MKEIGTYCLLCGGELIICLRCSGYGFSKAKKGWAIYCPNCEGKCPRCGLSKKQL